MLRTHTCGELRRAHDGQRVAVAGWAHRRRDHGGLIFVDLRDRYGLVQIVVNPEEAPAAHLVAEGLRNEFVLRAEGLVARRPQGTENALLPTGDVEVRVDRLEVLGPAQPLPFNINDEREVDETLRLRYRYLDLRRERMQRSLTLRHRVVKFMRDFLDARGFLEVETPILIKSTPEGARDYLVPSRVHPGHFYALPQSPQQLKQLLMVAGFDRYFQIVRCFRDEDQRADRQPEFTQLDLEMSFVDREDVLSLIEQLYTELIETVTPELSLQTPFPRLTHAEALRRFGSDKPDLRFGMEICDLSDLVAETEFQVFTAALAAGGQVRGIVAPGCAGYSRSQLDALTQRARDLGGRGLLAMAFHEGEVRSPAIRFLTAEQVVGIRERLQARPGDLALIVADGRPPGDAVLGGLRLELGERLGLIDHSRLVLAFVLDFPLFEWNERDERWDSAHHPFTAPLADDLHALEEDPGSVRSQAYDIVGNGFELGSGSIRIHEAALQRRVFRRLGYSEEEMGARFGHLLEAFSFGAPPHGGIAPGVDRLVMVLAGQPNIREVIAFPKNQAAIDPMTGAPTLASEAQLAELHLTVTPVVPEGSPPSG